MRAKCVYDKLVVFTKPGGHHYVDWMIKGETCEITEGYRYEDRTWKQKDFVKVKLNSGKEGYAFALGLSPIEVKSK